MVRVHAQPIGQGKVLVDRGELNDLIAAARQVEEVELLTSTDDLPADALMHLAQEGGSFEYLFDPREDVYSVNDLKVRYQ